MIGGCCVDTLAYGRYSNDYPLHSCLDSCHATCVRRPEVCEISDRPGFELLLQHEIDDLFSSRRSVSTNRVIKSAEDMFREFLSVKELNMLDLVFSSRSLDDAVKEFFLTVKRQDGERYKSKSLRTLKYAIKQFRRKDLT